MYKVYFCCCLLSRENRNNYEDFSAYSEGRITCCRTTERTGKYEEIGGGELGALLYLFAYACSFMRSVEASGTTPAAAVDAGVYEGAAESITAAVPETSGEIDGEKAVYLEAGETLSFTVQIPKDAAYTLGLLYCPGDDKRRPVEAAITVDGSLSV